MKLLVVDDQAIVRQGIAALLAHDDRQTVVLEAEDAESGLLLAVNHPDLDAVFLDLAMPGVGGMDAIEEFARRRPDVPIVVLTASDDPGKARQAFERGALGYVPKTANAGTLRAALTLVLSGEAFVPALLLREGGPARRDSRAGANAGLTTRQSDVLNGMALGLSNKAVGRRLGISEKTVKAHVTAVLRCLGAANRTDAVGEARARGLV
ncbi:MAG TPA: response regulator transcription factor [Caulobacteraceae bacterium]|jgi:DNA-binding NarL/FixJ family response regulator|nr:response regulator transcription factor [Caulobacteraceae bacterium]